MPEDLHTKIYVACWGAVAGGVVSIIVSLLFNVMLPRIKRWNLTRLIKVYPEDVHGSNLRCRVCNGGFWTIEQAMIYVALDYDLNNDVLLAPKGEVAFINPDHRIPLRGDQLCWSVRSPTVNPMKVDIFAKERQPFSPCDIRNDCIMIPSEEGWEFPKDGSPRKARVFLRRRREPYIGFIKIVSAETNARFFRITLDPNNGTKPIEIEPICAWDLPYTF